MEPNRVGQGKGAALAGGGAARESFTKEMILG